MNLSNKQKGILCILLAGLGFALMGLFVKFAGDVPTMQKAFFRNVVPVFIAGAGLRGLGEEIKLSKGDLKFLILRASFGTAGIICNFYALDHLKLSDANMLNKLSPFFAIIFSFIILKEKISIFQGIAVLGAFVGALFIIKPTGDVTMFPALIGALGGVGAGAAYTMVRILGKRRVNGKLVVFFFSVFSCLVSFPFLVMQFEPMSLNQTFLLLLSGIAAAVGQLAITKAYFYAPAKEISIYDYNQIILSAVLGFVFLNQLPDLYSFFGYAIIFGMGIWMYFYNQNR
ncbi:MAG: DMT family transporter [Catonella sp.]|uniref:DMT family transporter n=1 Tax=Catonella sp. TaxID=2382125 RepID=UPI003FA19449